MTRSSLRRLVTFRFSLQTQRRRHIAPSLLVAWIAFAAVPLSALAQAVGVDSNEEPEPAAADEGVSSRYRVGEAVQVEWRGTWYDAEILEIVDSTHWKIHYKNYGSSYDEVVSTSRIRGLNTAVSPLQFAGEAITRDALANGFPLHFYHMSPSVPVLGTYFLFYYLDEVSERKSGAELHSNAWDQAFAIPGGNRIAHAMGDTLRIWDLDTGAEIRRFRQPTAEYTESLSWHLAASPDGRYLYTTRSRNHYRSADTKHLSVWDVETGEEVHRLEASGPIPGAVGPISISPDGSLLAAFFLFSSRKDFSIERVALRIYRTTDWSLVREIAVRPHDDPIFFSYGLQDFNAQFTADGKAIYSLGGEGLHRWDFMKSVAPQRFPLSEDEVKSIRFFSLSPDGRFIATDDRTSTVVLRSAADLSEIRRWEFARGAHRKTAPIFDSSCRYLSISVEEADSAIADVNTGEIVGASDHVITAVTSDGRLGVSGRGYIMRFPSGKPLGRLTPLPGARHWAAAVDGPFFTASTETLTLIKDNVDAVNDDGRNFYANTPQRSESNKKFLATYNPNKVALVLQGVDPEMASQLPDDYRMPTVALRTTSMTQDAAAIHLDAIVHGPDAKVQAIELTRNREQPPESVMEAVNAAVAAGSTSTALTVPFPPGKNTMTLHAVVTDHLGVRSRPAVLTLERPEHVEEVGGRLFVLAVGVSKYLFPEYNLQFPAVDAEGIAAALKQQEGRTFGEVHIQVFTDERATTTNVKSGLDWLQRVTTADDVAVVFFSGHGLRGRRGLYYLTHEGDSENIQNSCLNWDAVATALQNMNARHTLFLSDACHAGAFAQSELDMQADLAKKLQEIKHVLVFASSKGDEVSLERDEWGHGAFTLAFLEGIGGHGDLNEDGRIAIGELIRYTQRRVSDLTQDTQHPYLPKSDGFDEQLVLSLSKQSAPEVSNPPIGTVLRPADIMEGTTSLGQVPAGTEFRIERSQDGWLYGTFTVQQKSVKGWVRESSVRKGQ